MKRRRTHRNPTPAAQADTLTVVLEEGFSNEHVIAQVGSRPVYDNAPVTTQLLTGLAASFAVPRNEDLAVHGITFELEKSGLRETANISTGVAALRVSVVDGRLQIRESKEMPGYL